MGYYADSYDGQILIPIKYEEQLKGVLKEIYHRDFDSEYATISGFDFFRSEDYISIDSFSDKWTSSEDEFLEAIAPIVEDGSYMCFSGDDACNWRIVYHDGAYEEQYSNLYNIWDTTTATVKHLNEDTNKIEDVSAPNGTYFYFKDSDVTAIKTFLEASKIDYAEGDSVSSILENNHTTFTCI